MSKLCMCTLSALGIMAGTALAGNIDSPASPMDAASAMPTVNGIYDRLNTGALSPPRTGAFTEPSAAPASSSHTLSDVLSVAPTADNINGALPSDVKAGKTYWSLRTDSTWGLQAGTSLSPPHKVAETGQSTCYNATGSVTACAGTGQDGALKLGAPWPNPRFTDNNNGTITDNLTGLIWLKDASCTGTVASVTNISGALTWTNALTWSNSLGSGKCGLSDSSIAGDWRLPNQAELASLLDLQYASPALSDKAGTGQWTSGNPFSTVQPSSYWTSSTYVTDAASAWVVHLGTGSVTFSNKANTNYVWTVRGGE